MWHREAPADGADREMSLDKSSLVYKVLWHKKTSLGDTDKRKTITRGSLQTKVSSFIG